MYLKRSFVRRSLSVILVSFFNLALALYGDEPPRVSVGKVKLASSEIARNYVGTVVPIEEVDVTARVVGVLERRCFKEGETVKKGQLLYQLEEVPYKAALDTLKANLLKAKAGLELAESEYKRRSALYEKKVITQTEYETVRCNYLTAKAGIQELEARIVDAENTYSYTKITAAQDGVISRSAFSEGNLVSPQSGPLASIKLMAPIYVRFTLSTKVFQREFGGMSRIRETADVSVRLSDGSVYPEVAKVTLIDNKINSTTDSITLWATFKNVDMALIPGAFVTVRIQPREHKKACCILPSALIMEQDGSYSAYVCTGDNTVEARKLRLGSVTETGLQIVLEGLSENETILVDGMHKVQPGGKCTPVFVR